MVITKPTTLNQIAYAAYRTYSKTKPGEDARKVLWVFAHELEAVSSEIEKEEEEEKNKNND